MSLTPKEISEIRELIAQRDIVATLYRLARGLDRQDKALLSSCFHEGATDDHAMFKGDATEFVDWVMDTLGNYERTQHFITNISVVFDGDKASSECYFYAHHVVPGEDGNKDVIAAGRYLDRFENRNGEWKIMHRKAVYDWSRVEESKSGWEKPPVSDILPRGKRGKGDLSYEFLKGLI